MALGWPIVKFQVRSKLHHKGGLEPNLKESVLEPEPESKPKTVRFMILVF